MSESIEMSDQEMYRIAISAMALVQIQLKKELKEHDYQMATYHMSYIEKLRSAMDVLGRKLA